jgi:hypothetical protein
MVQNAQNQDGHCLNLGLTGVVDGIVPARVAGRVNPREAESVVVPALKASDKSRTGLMDSVTFYGVAYCGWGLNE